MRTLGIVHQSWIFQTKAQERTESLQWIVDWLKRNSKEVTWTLVSVADKIGKPHAP